MLQPGAHIQVKRGLKVCGIDTGLPYWHHGILVGDGEVVDFGGGDLWHKAGTEVRHISLDSFRDGSDARAVAHPIKWSGITYSDPLPHNEVVDRALWLVANQPPRYQVGYRNCESIAIWCATGDFETFQVKRFMLGRAAVAPVLLYSLRKKPVLGFPLAAASVLVTLSTAVPYMHSRAFFDHVRAYPGLGKWDRRDSTGS